MRDIFELMSDKSLPPAVLLRDIVIQRSIDSFFPLYRELCQMSGLSSGDLTEFVRSAPKCQLLERALDFVDRNSLPENSSPMNGKEEPYTPNAARRAFLVWAAHQTNHGGYEPFQRNLKLARPDIKIPSKSHKVALYAARTWSESRSLDFSWGAVSRSIYRGLEGSNRTLMGKQFEECVREAVIQCCHQEGLSDARISRSEIEVAGSSGKSSRIDVVVEAAGRNIYFPCKSTQIGGTTHTTLFHRDVRDSLSSIGISPRDTLVVLGGLGWHKIVKDPDFRGVWVKDIAIRDDHLIERIRDCILDTEILANRHSAA